MSAQVGGSAEHRVNGGANGRGGNKVAITPDKSMRKAEPIDLIIASRIRQRRNEFGLSQVELAQKVGLSLQQIGKYESGGNRVSAARLFTIATALEVSVMWFYKDIDVGVDTNFSLKSAVASLDEATVRKLLEAFACLSTEQERKTAIALVATLVRHAGPSGSA
jgi:transcriptional regulator with XRE-family HTH domain